MGLVVLINVPLQLEKFGTILLNHVFVQPDSHGMMFHVSLVPTTKLGIVIVELANVQFLQHGMETSAQYVLVANDIINKLINANALKVKH